MAASILYRFGLIADSETVGIFIHGFSSDEYVGIDVHAQRAGGNNPDPVLDVNTSRVAVHVDGTLGHTIWVTNTRAHSPGEFLQFALANVVALREPIT